jgi:predicted XRE-type DNA-binding protein
MGIYQERARIALAVETRMNELSITQRGMAKELEIGRPLIKRITTTGSNYTIDSLLNVLDALDLELQIVKRETGQ